MRSYGIVLPKVSGRMVSRQVILKYPTLVQRLHKFSVFAWGGGFQILAFRVLFFHFGPVNFFPLNHRLLADFGRTLKEKDNPLAAEMHMPSSTKNTIN